MYFQEQFEQGLVRYVHNGNDTLKDEFSIMIKSDTRHKQSNPHIVRVFVTPENDQPPQVVLPAGFQTCAFFLIRSHMKFVTYMCMIGLKSPLLQLL